MMAPFAVEPATLPMIPPSDGAARGTDHQTALRIPGARHSTGREQQ